MTSAEIECHRLLVFGALRRSAEAEEWIAKWTANAIFTEPHPSLLDAEENAATRGSGEVACEQRGRLI